MRERRPFSAMHDDARYPRLEAKPLATSSDMARRFAAKLSEEAAPNACWEWQGARRRTSGYSILHRDDGAGTETLYAHRVSTPETVAPRRVAGPIEPRKPKDGLLNGVAAIAAYANMSHRQVYYLIASGDLPTFKLGRKVCSTCSMLDTWLEEVSRAIGVRS